MKNLQISKTDSEVSIAGILNFETVILAFEQVCKFIEHTDEKLLFNFSGLRQSNSAGLAFMINVLRYAKEKKKKVYFSYVPENLISAAKVSNLDELLLCDRTT